MSEEESVTQLTLNRIREEWEGPLRARISKLEKALTSARSQLVTLGGEPGPGDDAIQRAVLDTIDDALGNN